MARAVVLFGPEFESRAGVVDQLLTYFTLMKNKKLFNRTYLKPIRSFLRNNSTSAEAVLWTYLKSASIDGRKFRRQHSIGKYIADFYCPSEKLIVELDGEPHGDYIQIEKDKIRDKFLEGLGITVLRFENRLVFQDPEYILKEIKNDSGDNPKVMRFFFPGRGCFSKIAG